MSAPVVSLVLTVLNEATSIERFAALDRGAIAAPRRDRHRRWRLHRRHHARSSNVGRHACRCAYSTGRAQISLRGAMPGSPQRAARSSPSPMPGYASQPDWLAQLLAPFAPQGSTLHRRSSPDSSRPIRRRRSSARWVRRYCRRATISIRQRFCPPAARSPSSARRGQRVGGYPEWLDYCEDLIFDLRLREAELPIAFAPAAVAQFRPRSTLLAFWHQYFRYARGDGKAGLFARRHAIRYATYAALGPALLITRRYPLTWPLLILAGFGYVRRPYSAPPALAQATQHDRACSGGRLCADHPYGRRSGEDGGVSGGVVVALAALWREGELALDPRLSGHTIEGTRGRC